MDLYSIRNQRISPNEEFPLLCFRSASKECHARAERHTEKRKVLEEKKSGFPKTWQVCLACHRPCFGVSFFWVRKSLVATLSVLTTNRDPPPRSQVVHYSLPYKGISFSWTTPFGLIELSALICYWVTLRY